MVTVNEEDRERIRRRYYVEHVSIHQLARTEGYNRITIRKALADDPKPISSPPRQKPQPVFGAYKERIEHLLQENEKLPRKQRYTIHRMFEVIRTEGYEGSEATVRLYVSRRKIASHAPDVFLPLEYDPGQDAQIDWGEAVAIIAGQR